MSNDKRRHNAIGSTIMALVIVVAVGVVAWEHFPNLFGQDDVTVQETPTQTGVTQHEESEGKDINNVDVLGSDTAGDSNGSGQVLALDAQPTAIASTAVPEPVGYCEVLLVGAETGYSTLPTKNNTVWMDSELCSFMLTVVTMGHNSDVWPDSRLIIPPWMAK
jgi:hypothetical protein